MAIQIDRIDDKSDGFTVEFTVVNKYRRTFETRPSGMDSNTYAREQVQSIVTNPVEKPDGVVIASPAVVASQEQPTVIDLAAPSKAAAVPLPVMSGMSAELSAALKG